MGITHLGLNLLVPYIGEDAPGRSFDGVSDYVNVYSPALASVFNGDEGAFFVRCANDNIASTNTEYAVQGLGNGSNYIYTAKTITPSLLQNLRLASGNADSNNETSVPSGYIATGTNWSLANGTIDYRLTTGVLGTQDVVSHSFSAFLSSFTIGSNNTPDFFWTGEISHVILFYEYIDNAQTLSLWTKMDSGTITAQWIRDNISTKFVLWTLYPNRVNEEWGEGAPLVYTTSIATSTPTITTSSGTGEWRFIESDGTVTDYTSNSPSHVNAAGGSMIVALTNLSAIKDNILTLLIDNEAITSDWSDLNVDNGRLANLTQFACSNNTLMTGNVSNFTIPTNSLNFSNCGLLTGALTGDFPNIEFFTNNGNIGFDVTGKNVPPGFLYTYLHLNDNSVGDISSFVVPTTLVFLFTGGSQISGRPDFNQGVSKNFRTYICYSMDQWTQSDVDETINEIYACRADFTYATPSLQIGGTNPVPTGTFQYSATPSTPMEKIYALAYDPDDEGFNTWTITFNADTTEAGMVFNGSSDYVDVYTPRLGTVDVDEGCVLVRASNDDWTAGTNQYPFSVHTDANNAIQFYHPTTSGQFNLRRVANAVADLDPEGSISGTDYKTWAMNYTVTSDTQDYIRATGAAGTQDTGLDSWVGALVGGEIGRSSLNSTFYWDGKISHVVQFYEYINNTAMNTVWTKMDSGTITAQWIRDNISTKFVLWTLYDGTLGVIEEWGEAEDYASYTVTTTGADTHTINSLGVSASTRVYWGDGTYDDYTGTALRTHNYAGAGTYTVLIENPENVTTFDINDNKVTLNSADVAVMSNVLNFKVTNLKAGNFNSADITNWNPNDFRLYNISTYTGIFNSADITNWNPSSFQLYGLPLGYTGIFNSADITNWNPTTFYLINMPSTYTGLFNSADITNWNPVSFLLYLLPNHTIIIDTNGNGFSGFTSCTNFQMQGNSLSQSAVDDILYGLYQATIAPRTGVNGTITIGGTNAAPSGTFQAAAVCPVDGSTPGKEVAHELLNDGCAAGFNVWATVTITT